MVRALAAVATRVTVTQPPLPERVGEPGRMVDLFRKALGAGAVEFEEDPYRALDRGLADAKRNDVICVTGSMFLVGALRGRWVPEERILTQRSAAL